MAPPTASSIMLVSGKYFDYLDPDPRVITLEVLEHGLAVPRFNNQTIRPITIAEHCLRVDRIAHEIGDTTGWGLLHDAHEALTPWGDCLRPGKTQDMREAECRIDLAITGALGVPFPSTETQVIVKIADEIALYFESMLWQPGAIDWAPSVWPSRPDLFGQIGTLSIARFLPLIAPRPDECWRTEVERLTGSGRRLAR